MNRRTRERLYSILWCAFLISAVTGVLIYSITRTAPSARGCPTVSEHGRALADDRGRDVSVFRHNGRLLMYPFGTGFPAEGPYTDVTQCPASSLAGRDVPVMDGVAALFIPLLTNSIALMGFFCMLLPVTLLVLALTFVLFRDLFTRSLRENVTSLIREWADWRRRRVLHKGASRGGLCPPGEAMAYITSCGMVCITFSSLFNHSGFVLPFWLTCCVIYALLMCFIRIVGR